ncbi:MAG TPA: FAD-dependent monooxygenase [Burkholderiales bacterium]|nr:FAD-dependent monooxygenase [Burkholderiales bacterium]
MDHETVIVGGGIVGGSLAAALADGGVSVALIDSRSAPAHMPPLFDQRVYALRPASVRFLEKCGVWPHVDAARVAPVYEMAVFGDDGASRLHFDAYRSGIEELAVIVEDSNLQNAMSRALDARPLVTRMSGVTCVNAVWAADEVAIELDDGRGVTAQLGVAADGADSSLRGLAGIETRSAPYGELGVVANFACEQPHKGVAYQWFRADGVLALLPLPNDQVSMVWSTPQAHADELQRLEPHELSERVTAASRGVLGRLEATWGAAAFPLRRMRAAQTVGPRLALVGDAAHNVHPLAGQGLNLGLADAQALADALALRAPTEGCGSRALLARYRRSRSEDTLAMELVTDGLHSLFRAKLPAIAWLRNAGLRCTDRLTPLKKALVKRAAG